MRGAPRVGANNAAISNPKSRATQNATHWQVRSGANGVADEFSGGAGRSEGVCWNIGGPSVAGKYACNLSDVQGAGIVIPKKYFTGYF
jgi:hypothetical protein